MPALLLDPRVWGILVFCVLETFAGVTVYHKGVDRGRAAVQATFDAYVVRQQTDALREHVKRDADAQAMKVTNQEVTEKYEALKTATSTAILALDTARMRALSALAAARRSAAPSDPATGLPADATPEDRVLGECLGRYESVAGDAEAISNQLTALQDWVSHVVPK